MFWCTLIIFDSEYGFLSTKSLLYLSSSFVNSQRLLCSQKGWCEMCILKLSGVQINLSVWYSFSMQYHNMAKKVKNSKPHKYLTCNISVLHNNSETKVMQK